MAALLRKMTEKVQVQYYKIKHNAVDIDSDQSRDPSGIRSRIRDFVREESGLEVAVGGNYVQHDSTPCSGPYGNPEGTTYNSKMQIYHVHYCTIKVYGDYISNMNYGNEFYVILCGKEKNLKKISDGLDAALDISKSVEK